MNVPSPADEVIHVCRLAGAEVITLCYVVQDAYLANPALLKAFDTTWPVDQVLFEMERVAASTPVATATSQNDTIALAGDPNRNACETTLYFQSETLSAILDYVEKHAENHLRNVALYNRPAWVSTLTTLVNATGGDVRFNRCIRAVFHAARELGDFPSIILQHFIDIKAANLLSVATFSHRRKIGIEVQTPVEFVQKVCEAANDDVEKLLTEAEEGLPSMSDQEEMNAIASFMNTKITVLKLTLDGIKDFASRCKYGRSPANSNGNSQHRNNMIGNARNAMQTEVKAYRTHATKALHGAPIFCRPYWHKGLARKFPDIQYGYPPISRETGAIVEAVFDAAVALHNALAYKNTIFGVAH